MKEELRFILDSKFDFMEMTIEYPEASPEKILLNANELKPFLVKNNLRLLCHVPWYFHLAHPYERIRSCYVSETMKAIEVAGKLEAECVTIHAEISEGLPSKYFREMRREMLENFSDSLESIKDKADELGIQIMLENLDGKAMGMDELLWILDLKNVKATLDVSHAFIELEGDNDKLLDYVRRFKDRIGHMHLSDNFGDKDLHLPLGVGGVDWWGALREALKLGFDGTVTLEIHAEDRDYVLLSREKVLGELKKM